MRIVQFYSHQNGFEFIKYHKPNLWGEIELAIQSVDANSNRTKISAEKRMLGKALLAPKALNAAFSREFKKLHWKESRTNNWLTQDLNVLKSVVKLPPIEQKQFIKDKNLTPIKSYNQVDFVKDRIAVEIQMGKYSFVAHDLFVKHMSFFVNDVIDVGVEIIPMKEMEMQMSSGVAYFERDLFNVLRQGRGIPAVPLVLIGVAP
jgi:hypothetical protein